MNIFQPLKLRICEDCGAKFFGLWGKYCQKCLKKRKQKKMTTHRTREKICEDCGSVFKSTKWAKKCEACREKARKRNFEHTCEDCGTKFLGTKNTKICRECITKRMVAGRKNAGSFYSETAASVEFEYRKVKGDREPIRKYEECPNYNKDFVKCITCPAGSWRYKGCGTAKSDTDN